MATSDIVGLCLMFYPLTDERGWRQNFNNAGFPGIDQEYDELMRFLGLSPMATTTPSLDVIVDMSCGSGLMTRRLVQSGGFRRVIGADYSEWMLQETRLRFVSSGIDVPELVRADAARMPFLSDSLDAMHAGAALHCWPKLEVSEVGAKLHKGRVKRGCI